MKKSQTLAHWRALPDNQNPAPLMRAIPYRSRGSTYGACGIRIDGTPEFVDAVLSRLKPLLALESTSTRLGLSRKEVDSSFKSVPNAEARAEVCYIRLHQRGRQASLMNAAFGLIDSN